MRQSPVGPTIVVVGMGVVLPGATTLEALWPIVAEGRDMAREVPASRWLLPAEQSFAPGRPSPDRVYATRACLVDDDAALDFSGLDLEPNFVQTLDPSVHLLLHAGAQAWGSAVTKRVDRQRAGVIIGNIVLPTDGASALSDWIVGRELERAVFEQAGLSAPPDGRAPPSVWNRWVAALPVGVLARGLGLGGEHHTLDAACASSLFALHLAAAALQRGDADLMLTGGLSRPSSLYTQMGFCQLGALSPSGRCSPFDERGDGLIVGEGAGMLALKRLEDAQRDGDRIWAVLRGSGLSNDLDGNLLAPSTEGQLRAMRAAYDRAGWKPGDVDLVECHATGTPVGDAVEIASLKALIDGGCARPFLGAVKANVGHLLTGAGAAALIKTVLAMDHAIVPPIANFENASPRLNLPQAPVTIPTEAVPWPTGRSRRAAVSGFGFGGTNAHILLEHAAGIGAQRSRVQVPSEVTPVEIAIVGMAAHVGPWSTLEKIRERLFSQEVVSPTSKVRFGGHKTAHAGWFIDDLDVPMGVFRIPPNELVALLPQQLLALELARRALADMRGAVPQGPRAGVFVGVELDFGTTDYHLRWSARRHAPRWATALGRPSSGPEFERWVDGLCDALGPALDADRTMGGLASIAASRIAREFRFGGPSYAVSSEDTSGMSALISAAHALAAGELDAAYVGAVDLGGDVRARLAHAAVRNEVDAGQPMDSASPGVTPSEGGVGLVLKRLDDARRDGDRVYAVIEGMGTATGGGAPDDAPTADAHRRSAKRAHEDAGSPQLGIVDTAAAGLPMADAAELRGLEEMAASAPRISSKATFGDSGATSGLLAVLATALRLHHRLIESVRGVVQPLAGAGALLRGVQPWLADAADGDEDTRRRALVASASITGHVAHVVMGERDVSPWLPPANEALFVVEAESSQALQAGLKRLAEVAADAPGLSIDQLSRGWYQERGRDRDAKLAVVVIARDADSLAKLASDAARDLERTGDAGSRGGSRVFFSAEPLGRDGELAFVFPGSGSHFPGMGRMLGVDAPEALWRQQQQHAHLRSQLRPALAWNSTQAQMDADPRGLILAQVALGTLASDALRRFGVQPQAVLGYSLGETTGLFSLGAWQDRDAMLGRVFDGELFTRELAGECRAAARTWGLDEDEPVTWALGVVGAPAARVDAELQGRERVYRLIVNTPDECVVGGDADAVAALVEALKVPYHALPGVTTVHCEVARAVEEEYRELHRLPTTPPDGVRFYSGAWG
ncbi:MAG: acyltransferase domain-containing protein, partial [Nannocystaceae bacterium]|nr:acyltransferase domain-containing protein [Nannocystaceae bacterium]